MVAPYHFGFLRVRSSVRMSDNTHQLPSATNSQPLGIPKHVMAGEQLAGDRFYKANTASEETVEIVVTDAF